MKFLLFLTILFTIAIALSPSKLKVDAQGCANGGIPPACCENGSSSPYCCKLNYFNLKNYFDNISLKGENNSPSPYCCENGSPSPYCCENGSMSSDCRP